MIRVPPNFAILLLRRKRQLARRNIPRPRVRPYRGTGKKAKQYWRAEWHDHITGKHRVETWPKSEYTRDQAQDECDKLIRRECGLAGRVNPQMTLKQYWEHTFWPTREAHLALTSRRSYESAWANHLEPLHNTALEDIRPQDIDSAIVAMARDGYAAASCDVSLALCSSILESAQANGYIQRNPAHDVKVPRAARPKSATRSLTEAEAQRVIASVDPAERLIWRLLLQAGLRISEVFGLRPHDLLPGRWLQIERQSVYGAAELQEVKNRKVRRVPIGEDLWRDLEAHAGDSKTYLFPAPLTGGPQYRQSRAVALMLERARAASGIPHLTYRMCRTTFATLWRGDIADVQAIAGHHSAAFTVENYRRPIAERQLAGADELERRLRPKLRRVK